MITISKAVISQDDKYLLLKRDTISYPDTWDFAGGKDELNETPQESVIRETKEETSLDIIPGNEIKTIHYQDEKFDLLFHYFLPEIVRGELKISSDHSAYKWATKEEIKLLPLHPSVSEYFK